MKRIIRNIFLKNWGIKLFSFILALILWLILIPEERVFSEKNLTVPLEIHNIPSIMELVEKPLSTVDIKIRASNRLINEISSANVHAVLDLKDAFVGRNDIPLKKEMISIPVGVEVKDINPSQVQLRLEMTKEIMLDVEANLIGKMQEGFTLEKIEVIPAQVAVKGPESKINKKYKLRTSPIDLSLLTKSSELETDLILPNPDLKLSSPELKVKVRIVIQGQGEENPQEKNNKK